MKVRGEALQPAEATELIDYAIELAGEGWYCPWLLTGTASYGRSQAPGYPED